MKNPLATLPPLTLKPDLPETNLKKLTLQNEPQNPPLPGNTPSPHKLSHQSKVLKICPEFYSIPAGFFTTTALPLTPRAALYIANDTALFHFNQCCSAGYTRVCAVY